MFALVTGYVPRCSSNLFKFLIVPSLQIGAKFCLANMAEGEAFVCQCFFTHNIFLKNYEAHVVFESEEQFQCDYRKVCKY